MEKRLAENKMANVDLWHWNATYFCLYLTSNRLSELPLGISWVIWRETPQEDLVFQNRLIESYEKEDGHLLKSG